MRFNSKQLVFSFLIIAGFFVIINSCTHAPYVLPQNMRTGDPSICFERDVLPIFISNCAKSNCHDAASGKGGYRLDSYKEIMKKGIVPGNTAASVIWESIAIKTFNVQAMPIETPPIRPADLDLIRRWIATGATDSGVTCGISPCDSNNFTYSGAIAPLMQKYCIGCHNAPTSKGGNLTGYADVQNAAVNGKLIGNIKHLPGYNAMPTTGITLSDCEIAQVTKWVAAGALNN